MAAFAKGLVLGLALTLTVIVTFLATTDNRPECSTTPAGYIGDCR